VGKAVVQCKRWQTKQVSVMLVRELYGVMTAERADEAVFVSSGDYTAEARAFADGKPIRLIEGKTVLGMIQSVQKSEAASKAAATGSIVEKASPLPVEPAVSCPKCGSSMVQRTARAGSNSGTALWGCSTFPQCRGTRSIA
jgi:restriction system protein